VRVVMVSKACIVGAYQTKLDRLASFPDIELTVIVPPYWRGPEGLTLLDRPPAQTDYRMIVSPARLNGRFHLHYYPQLPALLRQLQPDIFHVDEEPYNLATYLALRAARTQGARCLFFSWQNLYRTYPWPFRAMEQASFRFADCALAGNEDARAVLRRKGFRRPIEVIPQFGVDLEQFAAAEPAPAPDHNGLRVAYAGRLVPEKGVDVLLRALAGLATPWRAVIAGGGPQEPALRSLASRLGIAERVDFAGRIPSVAMPEFFRGVDVLVLPSLSRPNWVEQFGRILVEAMASEVVVVGSDCGEIPRVIGDAGLVFPEGDPDALQGCLRRLGEDAGLRQRLARAGRKRAAALFSQEHIAQQTYDVYQTLMSGSFGAGGSVL